MAKYEYIIVSALNIVSCKQTAAKYACALIVSNQKMVLCND